VAGFQIDLWLALNDTKLQHIHHLLACDVPLPHPAQGVF
jgi:hypothetical protein